jgi:hypothetical protein
MLTTSRQSGPIIVYISVTWPRDYFSLEDDRAKYGHHLGFDGYVIWKFDCMQFLQISIFSGSNAVMSP